jgi:hypothetical protein
MCKTMFVLSVVTIVTIVLVRQRRQIGCHLIQLGEWLVAGADAPSPVSPTASWPPIRC